MYKAREQADILRELQELSQSSVSKIEGTFENDVLASNAIEFGKTEVELEQLYRAAFADTAWGEYLTMRAAEAGVFRKEAVRAVGVVTVTGNGELPVGSRFATEAGVVFETIEHVVVRNTATVSVQAVIAGVGGNVMPGTITEIPASIPGISGVTNTLATANGYDEETDASLLARYLLHVRTPGTTGNATHYLEWALSVPGVGSAKIIPAWNGPNTVKVIVVDANRDAAPEELLTKVATYIESVRPIGARVTVVSARKKMIDISVKITGRADKAAVEADIIEYFKNITTTYVSAAKIGDILFHTVGVDDYTSLTLNGEQGNLELATDELPVLGTVTLR
ncbi:baseplate J/gp47 family protein [Veillonella magna]|uniref:Baseplate J/gp47 family protein n=1 Tax=Veillonella magna TaxID=464322 RepID=A0ABS2GHD0_9FIRM|nr:baseplate J/gp47 family protein [Veillonella magna]MBM6824781.1 baseplate J/gp47 family protein [Veillonella magna]MBM6913140.1 baseplate J/gp47 family protein [Veillonella magna]